MNRFIIMHEHMHTFIQSLPVFLIFHELIMPSSRWYPIICCSTFFSHFMTFSILTLAFTTFLQWLILLVSSTWITWHQFTQLSSHKIIIYPCQYWYILYPFIISAHLCSVSYVHIILELSTRTYLSPFHSSYSSSTSHSYVLLPCNISVYSQPPHDLPFIQRDISVVASRANKFLNFFSI